MAYATPVRSFVGGLGLSLPVHALLKLNGDVFGISGFYHSAFKGSAPGLASVAGLLSAGIAIGLLGQEVQSRLTLTPIQIAVSGLLVGLGTKLGNGCTSGHMICGLSRFSQRSLASVLTFFSTAALTAQIVHGSNTPSNRGLDFSFGHDSQVLVAIQAVSLTITSLLYFQSSAKPEEASQAQQQRLLTRFLTAFDFAIALRLSNLVDARKVIGFLLLPFHKAFDPSLAFLAAGVLPAVITLYALRGQERPILGGKWSIPSRKDIDGKLLGGAAIFGIGWGISGICPGPGIVNFGSSLASGNGIIQYGIWLASVAVGGLFA